MSKLAKFSTEELRALRKAKYPELTDEEFDLFIMTAERVGLDPFRNQIYAVRRWNKRLNRYVMTIQTSIDGYRLLADRTGQYAGSDDAVYGPVDKAGHPAWATVTVYKLVGGQRCPFTATARWKEYVQLTSNGQVASMWRQMPFLMLGKCAEALALRKGFPQSLSGVYTDVEMMQADKADNQGDDDIEYRAKREARQKALKDSDYGPHPWDAETLRGVVLEKVEEAKPKRPGAPSQRALNTLRMLMEQIWEGEDAGDIRAKGYGLLKFFFGDEVNSLDDLSSAQVSVLLGWITNNERDSVTGYFIVQPYIKAEADACIAARLKELGQLELGSVADVADTDIDTVKAKEVPF